MKSFRRTLTLICLGLALIISALAAGELDPNFRADLLNFDYTSYTGSLERTTVSRVLIQPDGKILISGSFHSVNTAVRDGVARFNADGTLDTTFIPPILKGPTGPPYLNITGLDLQSDGKIIIGGNFTTGGLIVRRTLARLNTDGSLDASFDSNLGGGTIRDLDVGPDNKIVLSGDFGISNRSDVVRFLADGPVDTSFTSQVPSSPSNSGSYGVLAQADGKVLCSFKYSSGDGIMYRLNADGSIDVSHTLSGVSDIIKRFAIQPDGKILMGGSFNVIDGFPIANGLARLNANGMVDATFNPGSTGAGNDVNDIELLPSGKILIGGYFQSFNDISRRYIAVLNSNGTLDDSFNFDGRPLSANDLAVQSDGKIVVATIAASDEFGGTLYAPLARLNTDATQDFSLFPFIALAGRGYKVLVQPDGAVLAGGFFNHAGGRRKWNLARFTPDGGLDLGFNASTLNQDLLSQLSDLDLQPDGKILLAGTISSGTRLNSDGSYDLGLSNSPNPPSIRYLPSGKILIVSAAIRRYSATGIFESETATLNSSGVAYKSAVQPDGKILIVGSFTQVSGSGRSRLARLNSDGTLDGGWITPGTSGVVYEVALQTDGKIVISGSFQSVNSNSNYKYLARFNADGSHDTSFNPIINGPVTTFKLQPDGKILVAGNFTVVNGATRPSMVRLNPNGTLDNTFSIGAGTDEFIDSIDLQPDGKIIIGGQFRRVNGVDRVGLARLLNTTTPRPVLFDYDGDSKADISVFRPSENRWYVFRSSDSVVAQQAWAVAGDVPVPADYDGDQKTDYAIYRPSSGAWWYLSSINGAQINVNWGGEAGDIPRPSDFNGDGKTDFIIFRPTNSTWYRITSTGTVSNVAFGLSGDKPVVGDFDGDGKSDVAIYRPSTGDWWYQSSINNAQLAVRWGISTDVPAPADFDGDGKTDFAVFRPSTGVWYVINSSNGSFLIGPFGISEDKPVPADYDGDGKAELAVFRPSTGIWYQLRTNGGFFAMQFGISTDTPTPHSFVP